MVRLFLSIISILFIAIVINRIFDIKTGHWYMCFSLKDYVANSIFGQNRGFPSSRGSGLDTKSEMEKPWISNTSKSEMEKPGISNTSKGVTKENIGTDNWKGGGSDKKEVIIKRKKAEQEQNEKREQDPIGEIIQRVK